MNSAKVEPASVQRHDRIRKLQADEGHNALNQGDPRILSTYYLRMTFSEGVSASI